jgi:hypothetical protein
MMVAGLLVGLVSAAVGAEERCFSAKDVGADLLTRRLGAVHLRNVTVPEAARALRTGHGVPLSFLEAAVAPRVTVDLDNATVQDVLAAIVAGASAYQYGLVRDHLMLYPTDPSYALALPPDTISGLPRFEAAGRAGIQIRALKAFATMSLPGIEGDARHPLHSGLVSWQGSANVVERLADVAGLDPAVVVYIERDREGGLHMSLGFVAQVEALEASVSKKELAVGESVQIKVVGIGRAGTTWNMTPASCGAGYTAVSPRVASVDKDGLVTAMAPGRAFVGVHAQGVFRSVEIRVAAPGEEKK